MEPGLVLSILLIVGIVFASACTQGELSPRPTETSPDLATLVIDLQEGFSDDTVVIQVNGQEVYLERGVSTDYSVGRADSVETQVPEGSVDVEVTVPSRELSDTMELDVSETTYLGVSIREGRIDYRISDEMFPYY